MEKTLSPTKQTPEKQTKSAAKFFEVPQVSRLADRRKPTPGPFGVLCLQPRAFDLHQPVLSAKRNSESQQRNGPP